MVKKNFQDWVICLPIFIMSLNPEIFTVKFGSQSKPNLEICII